MENAMLTGDIYIQICNLKDSSTELKTISKFITDDFYRDQILCVASNLDETRQQLEKILKMYFEFTDLLNFNPRYAEVIIPLCSEKPTRKLFLSFCKSQKSLRFSISD